MKAWEKYIRDVKSGKIPVGIYIKQAVDRFERFRRRPDMYFDEEAVDECISFFSTMKHFLGKTAGKPFILEPWQAFIIAHTFGIKWKSNKFRVCQEVYCQIARKAGKDAFMAGICLYLLCIEGESSPEIVCAANSTDQARILFNYISQFSKSIDSNETVIKHYRNFVKTPFNNGVCKVISSDSSKADGMNISCFCLDEYHEAKDRKMYDVLKSSQGMREQPLAFIITTAGFNLVSPCHNMYGLGVEVLSGVKDMDNFNAFIYQMDMDDDIEDEDNWYKCQPNLDVTVTKEFMRGELTKMKADATAEVGVRTKTFNEWCSAATYWIPQEIIAQCMHDVPWEEFAGTISYLGVDLGSVSDFTSVSVMTEKEGKKFYKTITFIPRETLETHPDKELYQHFIQEGSMIVTPGNVTDYDYVLNEIRKISEITMIEGIYYDSWNSTSWAIKATELGYNMQPYSQAIGNFNNPTKEFERVIREGKMVIDKSSNILWQFGNVEMKMDHNGNCKPSKGSYGKKIDSVISMVTALGGYLKNPVGNDFELFII